MNQYCCQFSGKSIQELLGSKFLPQITDKLTQEQPQEQIELLHLRTWESQVISASGELHWLRWTNQPIIDLDWHLVEFQPFGIAQTKNSRKKLYV